MVTGELAMQGVFCNMVQTFYNGYHFIDNIFKQIFFNALKFVPTDNKSALVQIMAWHQRGDKSFPELMLTQIQTLSGITKPQWVKKNLRLTAIFVEELHIYRNAADGLSSCHDTPTFSSSFAWLSFFKPSFLFHSSGQHFLFNQITLSHYKHN